MKRTILIVSIAALCLFASCKNDPSAPANDNSVVNGVIIDEQSNPVPEAIVEAFSSTGGSVIDIDTTDETGTFLFKKITADNTNDISLRIRHDDFKDNSFSLNELIKNRTEKGCKIPVVHYDTCCGKLKIYVKKNSDSTPLANTEIRLTRENRTIRFVRTNDEGFVILENICPGRYWLRFSRTGYNVIEKDYVTENCDSTARYYYMTASEGSSDTCCNGMINVYPRDSVDITMLTGAIVKIWKDGVLFATKTVEQNGVTFKNLCPGRYGFDVYSNNYPHCEFVVEFTCNDTINYTKYIKKNDCCNGIFVLSAIHYENDNLRTLIGASVRITKNGVLAFEGLTGNDGTITLRNLCPGEYRGTISREHFISQDYHFVIVECHDSIYKAVNVLPVAEECCNSKVYTIVHDSATNARIQGATVRLWKGSQLIVERTSDDIGRVVFEALCHGEYQISIIKDGYVGREFHFTVDCGDTLELHNSIVLVNQPCCTAVLTLKVKDSVSLSTIAGATVTIKVNNDVITIGTTNAEGNVTFNELCAPKHYRIFISKDGYTTKLAEFNYEICNSKAETIKLVVSK